MGKFLVLSSAFQFFEAEGRGLAARQPALGCRRDPPSPSTPRAGARGSGESQGGPDVPLLLEHSQGT